jgi:anaerobic selenocysteine-containing dehydrogenase
VRTDLEIVQALAARLAVALPLGDARAWKRELLDPRLGQQGVMLEALERGGVRNPLVPKVLFEERRFLTPSGRARLVTEAPAPSDALRRDDDYPLVLLSLSTPASQSSQWTKRPPRPNECTVHPDASAGIADGALGRLESRIGAMTVRVRHDRKQRRDVAIVPKGGHLRDGACANALTRARLTDLGEGGALYDERVRLVPLTAGSPSSPAVD